MNRKLLYPILILLVALGVHLAEKYFPKQEVSTQQTNNFQENLSIFEEAFYPPSTTGQIIKHNYYRLSYNQKHLQAEWVAYNLHPNHLSNNSFERPYFQIDEKVKGGSANWRNYRNSGFDRGHLCPAGDRRFSYEAYVETFLTSNASPQNPEFNSGVWNRLEMQIRQWVPKTGELFIVTGGVLKPGLNTIGRDKVSVPEYFYKIVVGYNRDSPTAIGFLIPNKPSSKSLSTFVTPITQIEAMTGISFFENLDAETANKLKGPVDFNFWKLK